ncbi:efflux RND transporter periplasmic adaptor subunit [Gracilibacillus alcaliphilus]|uniref:efflux RND transporter periplasmic adaptor subunit n=1 Tax=Gracilibacillus alcaliphilus TaxID=1401441 RepID=UPI00195E6AD0|nr:efflux RND transporter periplasmic adaptor subunit [Gracilibacillus alcaliphilus]MBM7678402.1 multidrug efflux pump subunit AcrA (membrane-fusion protein) [Gracilibacillus alcaliphilus]
MKRLFVLFAMIAIALVACSNESENESEAEVVIPVETDEVTKGDLVVDRVFFGRTMPDQTTPIMPPGAAEVEELHVQNGDQVEEGDDLITLTTPQGEITIEAPGDGTVSQLAASEGSMVSDQEPIAMIIDLDQLTIQLQSPDTQLDLFKVGEEVNVSLTNQDDEAGKAEIISIDNMAGETGLFMVELTFDNTETDHRAGVVTKVTIKENVQQDTLLIPTAALTEENEETFVYIVDDDTAKRVDVTVKETQSEQTAVEADLSEGDQVIVSGQLTLTDGNEINVVGEE